MLPFYFALIDNEQDCRSFEEIYRTYRKQMLLSANAILHNSLDAEDAVHDAFIRIARNMRLVNQIKDPTDLRNYVLKASKNSALNLLKRDQKYQRCDSIENLPDMSDETFLDVVCDQVTCKETIAIIDQLDDRYKEVLYYHCILGFSVSEVASLLNRKVSTVKQQLVRGKKTLMSLLAERRTACENE